MELERRKTHGIVISPIVEDSSVSTWTAHLSADRASISQTVKHNVVPSGNPYYGSYFEIAG